MSDRDKPDPKLVEVLLRCILYVASDELKRLLHGHLGLVLLDYLRADQLVRECEHREQAEGDEVRVDDTVRFPL